MYYHHIYESYYYTFEHNPVLLLIDPKYPSIHYFVDLLNYHQFSDEFKLTARRALEMATIQGARALGMEDKLGSLTPGKRADVILVRTDHLTMGVFTDPAHLLVEATEEADIDTVLVDGRLLKRHGSLTAMDPNRVMADAAQTLAEVGARLK